MTIDLRNDGAPRVGWEPLEFLDLPTIAEMKATVSVTSSGDESRRRLSDATRVDIAQRVYGHLADLVERQHGDLEDVRSIVHTLGDRDEFSPGPCDENSALRPSS